MFIQNLLLKNFRNYQESPFTFSPGMNLIVGVNASGKSNLLEAIYFLATGKSLRVKGVEGEMIRYGEEVGRAEGWVVGCGLALSLSSSLEINSVEVLGCEGEGGEKRLEIILTTGEVRGEKVGKKKYLVNGVGRRQTDFLGNLRAVYFGPEDLELVTDSPSLRRKYLDMVLYQVDREYARASLSYEKGLRSRNKLLEEMRETGVVDRRRLFFWDQLLIKNGNIVSGGRRVFIDFLNRHGGIEGVGLASASPSRSGDFEVEYDGSAISEERLAKYADEEVAAGATLVGPHRDDFSFQIRNSDPPAGGRNLSVYGSRGEQRLAVLWLKLGELAFVKEKTDSLPVLLLDDIFSELDVEHRELVFSLIKNSQTIITTADLGMIEREWIKGIKVIELGI